MSALGTYFYRPLSQTACIHVYVAVMQEQATKGNREQYRQHKVEYVCFFHVFLCCTEEASNSYELVNSIKRP